MQVMINSRNFEVSPRLREHAEAKLSRLTRYLDTIDEVRMDLSIEPARSAEDRQVAQLTVRNKGTILRSEERSADMFASVDVVLDKMYRQIERFKGKRANRVRIETADLPALEPSDEEDRRIVRVKRFEVWPMNEEEAIEQMELLGHDFFIFYNADYGGVNVIYRRKDGDYGLLQPELS